MSAALDNLHPRVKEWFAEHKREQVDRARDIKNHRGGHFWGKSALADLTKRDLYRFNATSLIFTAVEKAGGAIAESPIYGKVTFLASGEKVECSIVEKLFKPVKADDRWTAYPEHHQTGLQSTGFLRVTINTYIGRRAPQWIETKEKKVPDLLAEVVEVIISAGTALIQMRREREESSRRREEEEIRRYEIQRARQIDDQQWARFCACAGNFDQRVKLLVFVAEIKKRAAAEGDVNVGGRTVSEWVRWAEERVAVLDPFSGGIAGLFVSVLGKSG